MTAAFSENRRRLTALRIAAQRIGARADPAAASDPAAAVSHLLAMQAQDFPGAKWSVGVRTRGATDAAVEASLASGDIVRSWPMRGTLHFVAAADLGWILSLTAPRTIAGSASRRRQLGLTDADLDGARSAAMENLSGGRVLTRSELLARFDAAGVATNGQRGYHLLGLLGLTATIVFGPPAGKQQTFALFDEWVRAPRVLERDEALGEFAERYFRGHGPATVRDFAWWSSLTLTDARAGLALARESLDEIEVDGTSYFRAADAPTTAPTGVHALAGFDEYLLGYQDRGAALDRRHAATIVPGGNGMFLPTIVVDGEIVGTWKRTVGAGGVRVEAIPFVPLAAEALDGFWSAAADYARFLGQPLIAREVASAVRPVE